MTRSRTALLLALPLAALPACQSNVPKPSGSVANRPKVAFVSNNSFPFWSYAEAGCNQAAGPAGAEVVVKKPDPGDAAVQKEIIDSLVNQDIKAIAVSVIDPENQTNYLNEIAGKVKLITVDNDAPASKRICYIGTNNYAAGREVGKLVQAAMPEGGVLAIFVGQLEALNARQRRQGVLDELAGRPAPADINKIESSPDGQAYGKYRLTKTYTDQADGAKAKQNASDALVQLAGEPNVCFVGLWAYNPPAILGAVRDQKKLKAVKIVGFDEEEATLSGVAAGDIYATVVQNPFEFGAESVRVMAGLAKGEPYSGDPIRYVPHRVITKDGGPGRMSVAAFQEELFKVKRSIR
jgi:ribose transport system substrate-binding protein